ncbi:hypothetical protein [Alicyclobacillus macrosporangiidus]|uniref:hypothetical protein n=1 Tax=Alicyclobacillus macrosporangiidus TaxID=392015 RepID=UPI001E2B6FDE|nr:hypothetical protein [Alicyclobacillus macrosporangiidus]
MPTALRRALHGPVLIVERLWLLSVRHPAHGQIAELTQQLLQPFDRRALAPRLQERQSSGGSRFRGRIGRFWRSSVRVAGVDAAPVARAGPVVRRAVVLSGRGELSLVWRGIRERF